VRASAVAAFAKNAGVHDSVVAAFAKNAGVHDSAVAAFAKNAGVRRRGPRSGERAYVKLAAASRSVVIPL
jgi:hypothetical protein